MKRDSFIKRIFLALVVSISISCAKDRELYSFTSDPQIATRGPFREAPITSEDNLAQVGRLGPGDPCFKYQDYEAVRLVASCSKLIDGRIKSSFKVTVASAKLCLFKKSFPEGASLFTLVGVTKESGKEDFLKEYEIDIIGQPKIEDGLLVFSMKTNQKSYVKYNSLKSMVTVREVSMLWKKRIRYFSLGCVKFSQINLP